MGSVTGFKPTQIRVWGKENPNGDDFSITLGAFSLYFCCAVLAFVYFLHTFGILLAYFLEAGEEAPLLRREAERIHPARATVPFNRRRDSDPALRGVRAFHRHIHHRHHLRCSHARFFPALTHFSTPEDRLLSRADRPRIAFRTDFSEFWIKGSGLASSGF
ncbi:hypothetical protein KC19_6G148600 [Ceratodon purpureus]|uniref:Uncharacterized protein n=1 Tax=Ceratodon purpureus TaxID=3225 RepID=A0A8T0HHN8_CERPU|nr:hypothetical protein KC19_6G148600 [Ceratodon purpureus]